MDDAEWRALDDLSIDEVLVEFVVSVDTSAIDEAGTDSNIFFGIDGVEFLLDHPDYNDFERGDRDHYHFAFVREMTVDDLNRAQLTLRNEGDGRNAGWYCARVRLFAQPEGPACMYLYEEWKDVGWLARDGDAGLLRVLQVGVAPQAGASHAPRSSSSKQR